MQASSPLITLSPSSPSFNSYSSGKLAEIAARVVQEFATESDTTDDQDCIFSWNPDDDDNHCIHHHHFPVGFRQEEEVTDNKVEERHRNEEELDDDDNNDNDDDDDEDFEFAVSSSTDIDSFSISAEDIFYNGQIRPIYPLFDTNLLLNHEEEPPAAVSSSPKPSAGEHVPNDGGKTFKPRRPPLRKLFSDENESQHSCSSSEADELDRLAPGTYCVWTPKKPPSAAAGSTCKKSSSTGSSKRWKFRDLLYRSNSDGKDTFVFLTPPAPLKTTKGNNNNKIISDLHHHQEGITNNNNKEKEMKVKRGIEEHYVRNRAIKEGDKRRSFLPYRQDLVGFLSNANGVSRNLHPF
ncbi:hypothetical protein Tsubulata_042810 [Turnera subulata]|uniref:DUF1645 domain-containing protein n=1 Tax=Turnera subulata TaxID=218843 RepID=A0A9Q0FJT8_9ROSI|nr:hypothetical protein Tsubulata_042810 [Turnera subulata]